MTRPGIAHIQSCISIQSLSNGNIVQPKAIPAFGRHEAHGDDLAQGFTGTASHPAPHHEKKSSGKFLVKKYFFLALIFWPFGINSFHRYLFATFARTQVPKNSFQFRYCLTEYPPGKPAIERISS
jgi:hypothetical protein